MTDRVTRLTVRLEEDLREDDCKQLIDAILMMRGVLSVAPTTTDCAERDARHKVALRIEDQILELLKELRK